MAELHWRYLMGFGPKDREFLEYVAEEGNCYTDMNLLAQQTTMDDFRRRVNLGVLRPAEEKIAERDGIGKHVPGLNWVYHSAETLGEVIGIEGVRNMNVVYTRGFQEIVGFEVAVFGVTDMDVIKGIASNICVRAKEQGRKPFLGNVYTALDGSKGRLKVDFADADHLCANYCRHLLDQDVLDGEKEAPKVLVALMPDYNNKFYDEDGYDTKIPHPTIKWDKKD